MQREIRTQTWGAKASLASVDALTSSSLMGSRSLTESAHLRPRRGIALLFVISLIVVFFLFATTFVAMSSSFMRSSDKQLRMERTRQLKVRNVTDDVFYLLIRDTATTSHPLSGQSILADQYGMGRFERVLDPTLSGGAVEFDRSGTFMGVASRVHANVSYPSQVFEIVFRGDLQGSPEKLAALIRAGRDDFAGRWVTFLDGPMANQTMPVLDYRFELVGGANPSNVFCSLFVLSRSQWPLDASRDVLNMQNTRFVANGRPFDSEILADRNESYDSVEDWATLPGNPAIPTPPAAHPNAFLALNARGNGGLNAMIPSLHRYRYFANRAINGSWQDMVSVARQSLRPNPVDNPNFTGSNPNSVFLSNYTNPVDRFPAIVPDMQAEGYVRENGFEPRLPQHWQHLLHGILGNDPAALAALNLPQYAGLDVDNDGDGQADSMWMDIGLSPIQLPNGRRVVPLVAVMIEDLDGRVNLNAHGSLAHLRNGSPVSPALRIPFGQGYGPADVPLGTVLAGRIPEATVLGLRYGLDPVSLNVGSPDAPNLINPLQAARWAGFLDVNALTLAAGLYGTASDYQGQFAVAPVGQPVDISLTPVGTPGMNLPFFQGQAQMRPLIDSPYEMDLFRDGQGRRYFDYSGPSLITGPAAWTEADQPFGADVQEAILRAHDSDAVQLGQKAIKRRDFQEAQMAALLNAVDPRNGAASEALRKQLTASSFEVPAIPVNLAGFLRNVLLHRDLTGASNAIASAASHFQPERAFYRSPPANVMDPPEQQLLMRVEQQILLMLGRDVVSGLPFNLHRKFGNGVDENGNGVLDEYGDPALAVGLESNTQQRALSSDVLIDATGATAIPMDFDNDGTAGEADEYLARSEFARQLYTLAVMMTEPNYKVSTANLSPEARRRRIALAQWAINVVDFQDADSIMTPFEFDINPFNGWHVDGNLRSRPSLTAGFLEAGVELEVADILDGSVANERFVVWGVERPDLLLTEAAAFHDHRSVTISPGNADQSHIPVGSAFIEVYNPNIYTDSDVQTQADTHLGGGVNLRKQTPAGEPAYRMLVVRQEDRGLNPDRSISAFDAFSPDHLDGNGDPSGLMRASNVERTIYFVNPQPLMTRIDAITPTPETEMQLVKGLIQHFPSTDVPLALFPGEHAVVGSAGPHNQIAATRFMTIFGRVPGAVTDDTYDPAVDSLDRPAIRLLPGQPVLVGRYDPNDGTKMVALPNSIGVPLDMADPTAVAVTPLPASRFRNFSISEPITPYNLLDASGTVNAVPEEDGFRYETPYTACFYEPGGSDEDIAVYGRIIDNNDMDNPSNPSFRHVVLQRLANPQIAFDPIHNPYITMDDIAIGLNAYGGLGIDATLQTGAIDMLTSMQRGEAGTAKFSFNPAMTVPAVDDKNVWLRSLDGLWAQSNIPSGAIGTFPVDLFDYALTPSLANRVSLGLTNPAFTAQVAKAVPWLRIANRPLISQFELASVPVQSNSLLLEHVVWPLFDSFSPHDDNLFFDQFGTMGVLTQDTTIFDNAPDLRRVPTHLLNFYGEAPVVDDPLSNRRPLSRLFEFTSVPSPFVGTETFLNPLPRAAGGFSVDNNGWFNAPNNLLSNRRNPGKININSIAWQSVWNSLIASGLSPAYLTNTQFNDYRNQFRDTAANGRLVSNDTVLLDPILQNLAGGVATPYALPASSTASSLWRRDPNGAQTRPLLDHTSKDENYMTDRNEYFRLQKRQRLANLTSQRSSVFAIWITVGYFEQEQVEIPVPDDVTVNFDTVVFNNRNVEWRTSIGREYGLDDGKVKRDRAFYLFDRSVPVGFVPGENLNVDNAVLLKRYIE